MKRKILLFLGGILMILAMATAPEPAMAASCDSDSSKILGFKPWYDGLCENGEIKPENKTEDAIKRFAWRIVLNISFDLSLTIGILGMAMIIYGGYMYMTSSGDPTKAARGQKTIMRAIIGMIIALSASVVINTVTEFSDFGEKGASVATILDEAFGWAFTVAGIVAVGFVIKAGIDFLTSSGDPAKAAKATKGIIFALIGLVVVIAARLITTFVLKSVGE